MTTQITLALPDEVNAKLRAEFEHFVRLSTGLDKQFVPPAYEDFLRARVLHQDAPLTERAVTRLLNGGEYGWAKRVFHKQLPHAFSQVIRDAQQFGFTLAVRHDLSQQDRVAKARDWMRTVLEQSGSDPALTDDLANQVALAATDIRLAEEQMQSPAWRLADSLRKRVYDLLYMVQTERGTTAALARLGELRGLLSLAQEYGSVDAQEAVRVMEQLQHARPQLFREEPDDVFARVAAWLRQMFAH